MKRAVLMGVAVSATWACGGGDDGDGPTPDAAVDASLLDMDRPPRPDLGPIEDMAPPPPDMGVPVCFSEGGALEVSSVSDPIPGLVAFAADLDSDLDDRPELLYRRALDDGIRFEVVDGLTAEVEGGFTLATAVDAAFMPGLWPPPDRRSPITVDGTRVWYVSLTDLADETSIATYDAETYDAIDAVTLGPVAERVQVVPTNRWLVLSDRRDGGCAIHALDAADALGEWGLCRLSPVADVNGDGSPEVLRWGRAGLELYDGNLLEAIATELGTEIHGVGLGDDGPLDVRGTGPELVTATIDGAAVTVEFRDPIDLTVNGEGTRLQTVGLYERIRFVESGGVLRLVGEINRNEQLFLHLIEPARDVRRLREFGPFQVMRWSLGGDIDGDGVAEIELRGGADRDGTNTTVRYIALDDGLDVYEIERERSAIFEPVWTSGATPSVADLDGCEGFDRVHLRSGLPNGDGVRATRVLFIDEDDRERVRSDTYSGRVHQLTIADLDGNAPPELLEIRSDDDTAARLRVYTPTR